MEITVPAAFKILSGIVSGYENGKKQLFDEHVDPLKNKIDAIHSDYIQSFIEVRSSLKKKNIPIDDLLDFLEDRRHQLAGQRDLTIHLAEKLSEADRRVVPSKAWNDLKKFCSCVDSYFEATNSVGCYSWYSDFINFMRVKRMSGREKGFFDDMVFGNDPRRDVIHHLDVLIEERLPGALRAVNESYAVLKVTLK